MSRSVSLFESGLDRGMGFRDSNQDLLGFVHMAPDRARARILDLASTQLPTGGAYHQFQPLTKRGNNDIGSGFNDDPLWLVLAVAAYVKETGDAAILDEPVPYDNAAGQRDTAVRAPGAGRCSYTLDRLGPHCAAAHRPGRLERLPEPQLLLRHAGGVLPDDGEQGRRRAPSRCSSPGCSSWPPRNWPSMAERRGLAGDAAGYRAEADKMAGRGRRARLGRRVVPPRIRLFRQRGRVQRERGGPDLRRAAGHLRDGRHRRGERHGHPGAGQRRRASGHRPRHRAAAPGVHAATTSSWARYPPTRPATRRTRASSATPTRG